MRNIRKLCVRFACFCSRFFIAVTLIVTYAFLEIPESLWNYI